MRSRSPMILPLAGAIILVGAIAGCGSSGGGGGGYYARDLKGGGDMSVSTPRDLSQPPGPMDLRQPVSVDLKQTTYKYGCYGLIGCINNCQDQTCFDGCLAQASPASQNLFKSLYNCLFVTACPVQNGGVCDDAATNYDPNKCDACIQAAQQQGGACSNQVQACVNDKP